MELFFFPGGWALLVAALVGVAAFLRPGAGLALALAVPVLPLGNASLGLALAYVPLALLWLALFARDARSGLLFLTGPFLGALHLLPLAAIVALRAKGPVRAAATALAAVGAAVAAAAVTETKLPLTGEPPPATSGIGDTERPLPAVDAALAAFWSRPTLVVAALVLAAAAAAAPAARDRGLWGVAAWGAGLAAALLLLPLAAGGEAVVAVWAIPAVWAASVALACPLVAARR